MTRISVTKTFEGAYTFLFSNGLAIIGIAWLPYALLVGVTVALLSAVVPPAWLHGSLPPLTREEVLPFLPKALGLYGFVLLLWTVVGSIVSVGVLRRALGLSRGPVFFYFTLGAPVWRLIGANLLVGLALIAIGCFIAAACGAVVVATGSSMSQGGAALTDVVAIGAGFCAWIYIVVRWTFFIAPVVVAEEHIGLGRAWHLGGGNFWRILAVVLVVYLPISFVGGIVTQIIMSITAGGSFANFPDNPTPQQIAAALHQLFVAVLPAAGISTVLQTLALAGASGGAQAIAYRQMTETQPN